MNLQTAIRDWDILNKTRWEVALEMKKQYEAIPVTLFHELEVGKLYWQRYAHTTYGFHPGKLVQVVRLSPKKRFVLVREIKGEAEYKVYATSAYEKEYRAVDEKLNEIFNVTPEEWTDLLGQALSAGYIISEEVRKENLELLYNDCPRNLNSVRFDYLKGLSAEALRETENEANTTLQMIRWLKEKKLTKE